jgi:hypothetical protein
MAARLISINDRDRLRNTLRGSIVKDRSSEPWEQAMADLAR